METKSVTERLKDIVFDHLQVEAKDITPEATFIGTFKADSLDWVEIVMATEEEFNICIDDDVLEKDMTFQQVVDLVQSILSKIKQPK